MFSAGGHFMRALCRSGSEFNDSQAAEIQSATSQDIQGNKTDALNSAHSCSYHTILY